jgi:hypothetical protein
VFVVSSSYLFCALHGRTWSNDHYEISWQSNALQKIILLAFLILLLSKPGIYGFEEPPSDRIFISMMLRMDAYLSLASTTFT